MTSRDATDQTPSVKKSNRIRSKPLLLKKDYVLHSMRRKTRRKLASDEHEYAAFGNSPSTVARKISSTSDGNLRFMCQKCDYDTTNFKDYMHHMDTHPGLNSKILQCSECEFKTSKLGLLKKHNKLHLEDKLVCTLCRFQATNLLEYNEHKSKHYGDLPFFCTECDLRFQKRSQLESHKPKHWLKKPFICPVCEAGFKWKHALKNHMVTHTTKKEHLCDICGYATGHKSMLTAHQLLHTGETFKCVVEGCSFEATKKQKLKSHMVTHTREKPHQCEVCGQRFSLAKNMRRHTLLHSNTRPIACKICSFTTTRYDKLKEHNLKSHNIGFPSAPKKPKVQEEVSTSDLTSTVTLVCTENIMINPDGTISAEQLQKIAELAAAQQNDHDLAEGLEPPKETIVNIESLKEDGTTLPLLTHIQFSSKTVPDEVKTEDSQEIAPDME